MQQVLQLVKFWEFGLGVSLQLLTEIITGIMTNLSHPGCLTGRAKGHLVKRVQGFPRGEQLKSNLFIN